MSTTTQDDKLSAPHQRRVFVESGVANDVAQERDYFTIPKGDKVALKYCYDQGYSNMASAIKRGDVLATNLWRLTGERVPQYRPDVPRKDGKRNDRLVKYENPNGVALFPDVHPRIKSRVLRNNEPLWITEGIFKADAAISHGLCCVGLVGVAMFRDPHTDVPCLHPDFDQMQLRGRDVFVAFDSDVMVKTEVQRNLHELGRLLRERGAKVRFVFLPQNGTEKVGLDDYFVAGGTVEQLRALTRDPNDTRPTLDVQNMAGVEPETVDWLWDKRIPFGHVTPLVGDGGVGKSFVTLGIAAAVTRGVYLPGDDRRGHASNPAPADVLIANYEDGIGTGLAQIMAPRVRSVDADPARVFVVKGQVDGHGKRMPFNRDSVPEIEAVLDKHPNIKLLVIDPVMAFMGKGDVNRDNEVRDALEPLYAMVATRGIACILVAHMRKQEAAKALEKVAGSVAFVNSVRSVLLAFWDIEEDEEGNEVSRTRIVRCEKHNLAPDSDAVPFYIENDGAFRWGAPMPEVTADGSMTTTGKAKRKMGQNVREDSAQLSRAKEFLGQKFANGGMFKSMDIIAEAKRLGISKKVFDRAKDDINVGSFRPEEQRNQGPWWMRVNPSPPF